ncbi:MAG: recombinase family protein [Sphingobacteriales bacterium]|nr:MAG: recombinase family protein [Sphingobacteriales bacterium]
MKAASKNSSLVNPLSVLFNQFGKGKQQQALRSQSCVIYTRVSTKEQADNNLSLETQRKACEQFAQKQNLVIQGYFGGTYESAKTDERKQFNAMLSFVKKSSAKVSTIIVYSVDRFSRSGANAIYLAQQLKAIGITINAVTQPTDATTASGMLQQNIQFIFSEYDNQLRREKCMAGMKEKLLAGGWVGRQPLGYDIVQRDGKKAIVLNSKGKLIRRAFEWRLQGMSNEAVRDKLEKSGWKTSGQRVSDFLRNPFYCGLVVHNALEGQVIEGHQEKAVSKELFLQVNSLLAKNTYGYSTKPDNDEAPLKKFLRCATSY